MNPNGNLTNLKPFKSGHKSPRASAAKLRALTGARLAFPEMVDIAIAIARDIEEPTLARLKPVESVLCMAFPTKSIQADEFTERPGTRFLDVVLVHRSEKEVRAAEQVEARPDGRGTFSVSFGAK